MSVSSPDVFLDGAGIPRLLSRRSCYRDWVVPRIDVDARKAQLAEAVWQVILTRGMSAVSIRNVAEQAGVVAGSLRHVFPTRAELMKFSAELMVERATERVLAVPRCDDSEEYVFGIAEQLLPLSPDTRAEFEVNMALVGESAALPDLLTVRDEAYRRMTEVSLRMVELLSGSSRRDSDMRAEAQRLHALIDGLAFHLLHQGLGDDATWALDIVRAELSRIRSSYSASRRDR